MDSTPAPTLFDLIGIEHSKLGYFEELRQKIEELKTSNTESENRRREIGAILDGITDVMMVLDEDLKIISVNHVFHDLFGKGNPIGQYCYSYFRQSDEPCEECPAFRSLKENIVSKETAIFRIGGRNMQFEMVASPLKNPQWPKHRVLIFKRDVTMEKEYQAKYYQAEKMATIGVLATGVAHEVNNPLAAISGYAEGIQRRLATIESHVPESLAEDFRDYTETIIKECRRCRDIVRTLLHFGHPVSSQFCILDVNNMVRETLKILHYHLKRKTGIIVDTQLYYGLPHIEGDEPQLKQVLLNLLTNAVDAMDAHKQKGVISVRTSPLGLDKVLIEVEDTGCGIPPANRDKLFDPFFTTKPVGKGIGIGLSTCYNIVKEHQGDISVDSEIGRGSRFIVTLPLKPERTHG